jgi:hypothetical protein
MSSLAKEIAELRAKYDLKSHSLPVNLLITSFDHDPSRAVGSARSVITASADAT